jgi:hypothetical protein
LRLQAGGEMFSYAAAQQERQPRRRSSIIRFPSGQQRRVGPLRQVQSLLNYTHGIGAIRYLVEYWLPVRRVSGPILY